MYVAIGVATPPRRRNGNDRHPIESVWTSFWLHARIPPIFNGTVGDDLSRFLGTILRAGEP